MKTAMGLTPASTALSSRTNFPYPEVNALMPREGLGFYCRMSADRRFGLPETIKALTAVGVAWHQRYPNGPRMIISDISKQGGGKLCFGNGRCHKSHQLGLDIDIRPVRTDTGEGPVTHNDPAYSQSRTRDLINLILNNTVLPVKDIAFCDRGITGPAIRRWDGHHDHLHVRFCAPGYFLSKVSSRYKGCVQV
jgi:hypothetical protein